MDQKMFLMLKLTKTRFRLGLHPYPIEGAYNYHPDLITAGGTIHKQAESDKIVSKRISIVHFI